MKKYLVLFLILVSVGSVSAIDSFNNEESFFKLYPRAEFGAFKVLNHTIQFGESGTMFDYVKEGGQEILFPYSRLSLDLQLGKRNTVTLLYQPLTVQTKTVIPADEDNVVVEDVTFTPGTALNLKYGFDFWRASYLFGIFADGPFYLGAGLSLQLRNASIVFESTDGVGVTVNQNLGPVPILKLKSEYRFPRGFFFGAEVDGFYASSAVFNGAGFQFEGWIYDAALYAGTELNPMTDAYLTVRLLGGGARGTSQYEARFWTQGDNLYTDNALTTLIISAGARLK